MLKSCVRLIEAIKQCQTPLGGPASGHGPELGFSIEVS